jgi:hypothetical protein
MQLFVALLAVAAVALAYTTDQQAAIDALKFEVAWDAQALTAEISRALQNEQRIGYVLDSEVCTGCSVLWTPLTGCADFPCLVCPLVSCWICCV